VEKEKAVRAEELSLRCFVVESSFLLRQKKIGEQQIMPLADSLLDRYYSP
jgi:hypothetical protein